LKVKIYFLKDENPTVMFWAKAAYEQITTAPRDWLAKLKRITVMGLGCLTGRKIKKKPNLIREVNGH